MPVATLNRVDKRTRPLQTVVIQNQYSAEFYKRFRKLKSLILQTIVDNDAFRLKRSRPIVTALAAAAKPFEFTENPEKIKAFMAWLREAQDDEVLGVIHREGREVVAHTEWQNIYVRRSYEKGVRHAEYHLRRLGYDIPEEDIRALFFRPIHADALGMAYTRHFTELQGITEAMDQQISRELVGGMARGENARVIATNINNRVEHIGLTRARTLARTEVNRAANVASLNRYQEYGVEKVEWIATGRRPCPLCEGHDGDTYTRKEAQGVLPAHPRCRCAWGPVV